MIMSRFRCFILQRELKTGPYGCVGARSESPILVLLGAAAAAGGRRGSGIRGSSLRAAAGSRRRFGRDLGGRGAIETLSLALSIIDLNNIDHRLPELDSVHPLLDDAKRSRQVEKVGGGNGNSSIGGNANLGEHSQEVKNQEGTFVTSAKDEQDVLVAVVVLQEDVLGGATSL